MEKKVVRVPLIVGSNGKWCAYGWSDMKEADWLMMDEIADSETDLPYPRRYWITAEIEVPVGEPEEIDAANIEAATAARPIIERKVAERIVRWLWFSDDPIAVLSDVSVKFNLDLTDPKDGYDNGAQS